MKKTTMVKRCPCCGKPPRVFSYASAGGAWDVVCDNVRCGIYGMVMSKYLWSRRYSGKMVKAELIRG